MTLLNEVAIGFERRFLYGYGRHLWNLLGVVGLGLIASGVIFAIDSQVPSSNLSIKEIEIYKSDFKLWVSRSPDALKFFNSPPDDDGDWLKIIQDWNGSKSYSMGSKQRECYAALMIESYPSKYTRSTCNERGMPVDVLVEKWKMFSITRDGQAVKTARLQMSPVIAGSGLGIIAYVSVVSAILSIERNTRKD